MATGDIPSQTNLQWINRLILAHNYELPELWRLLEYYESRQRLSYMHPEPQATLDERVRQAVINWPRLVVDALEERIDLQGFRLGGQPANDTELDHVAQYNDLDAGYQQAYVTAMVMKRAYAIVGANPRPGKAKYPLVTIESPLEVHVELDPATKRVVAAIKRWHDIAPDGAIRHYLTLYRPDYTVTFVTAPEAGPDRTRPRRDLRRRRSRSRRQDRPRAAHAPGGSSETTDRADQVTARMTVYAELRADVLATDRVTLPDGTRWQVVGEPQRFPSPFTADHGVCVVNLERVTG